MRRVKGLLGVVVGLMLLFHAGGTTAYADDKGNNGTLKVHEAGTSDASNENDPHVCNFHLNGNGFDKSSSGTWKIEKDPNGSTVVASGTWTANTSGDWRTADMTLPDGHYRASAKQTSPATSGGDKQKVFWVKCGETAAGGNTGNTGNTGGNNNGNGNQPASQPTNGSNTGSKSKSGTGSKSKAKGSASGTGSQSKNKASNGASGVSNAATASAPSATNNASNTNSQSDHGETPAAGGTGSTGTNGSTGTTGSTGTNGVAGTGVGTTGATGTTNTGTGTTGSTGTTAATGAAGATGDTGNIVASSGFGNVPPPVAGMGAAPGVSSLPSTSTESNAPLGALGMLILGSGAFLLRRTKSPTR